MTATAALAPPPAPARARAPGLLTLGNSKLGRLIHAWSIPAGPTCPGATDFCRLRCYAARGFFVMPSNAARHEANRVASTRRSFPSAMRRAIDREFARVVRIHVAGDFYDAAYVGRWTAIVRSRPAVAFFAYTRSWRVPAMLPALAALAALPNMHLWFSEDRDTGASPPVPGVRVAFMLGAVADEALVGPGTDLVFRDLPHAKARAGRVKWVGGALVCPHEQAPTRAGAVTCSTCQLCFTRRVPTAVGA